MTFGQRLATLRKQSGLTQQKLGEQLNVSAQAVSKWENDQAEPDVATICRLAKIFNISTDTLLMGADRFDKKSVDSHLTRGSGAQAPQSTKRRALLFVIIATLTCLIATIVLLGIFVFSDELATKPPHIPTISSFPSPYFTHIKGDFLP